MHHCRSVTPVSRREPEVDIVAVHDLNGDARKTWTSKKSRLCWLHHQDFLPKYLKKARILTWGYNATFSFLKGANPSNDRIHQHAHTLVANLSADRRLSRTTDKPIIFLCHSLGGIVVKRALSYAQTRTASKVCHEYDIFASTYGILFFGTPHTGSSKAMWLSYLSKIASIRDHPLTTQSKRDTAAVLGHHSETLQNVTDFFTPIMKNFNIYFFWEQEKTAVSIMGKDFIVTKDSAAPLYDETERAGIAATHSGMIKFEDPSDPGFRIVLDALMRYCADAPGVIKRNQLLAQDMLALERRKEIAMAMDPVQDASLTSSSTLTHQPSDEPPK